MILSGDTDFRVEFFAAMPNYSVFAFFVISGFLIYASLDKLRDTRKYFVNRAKRILPAYVAVVVFFAVFLFFFSGGSAKEYFSASWLKYLGVNLIFLNFLEPCINFVFTDNPTCAVNGSLWTIKVEVMFYLFVPVLFWFIKHKSKIIQNGTLIVLYLLSLLYFTGMNLLGKDTLAKQFPGCLTYFVSGILLYLNLDFFKKHQWKFIIPAISIILVEKLLFHYTALFPFALGIVIIGFAYSKIPLQNFAKFGDISYGMYLLHYPIIQLFIQLGWYETNWGILLSFGVIILASFASWYLIEQPFLRKKFKHTPA